MSIVDTLNHLELSTAFIHGVENYKLVISGYLAPASSERESNGNKAKTNDHIPSTYVRDWVGSCGYVENYDPD